MQYKEKVRIIQNIVKGFLNKWFTDTSRNAKINLKNTLNYLLVF